eukprot:jgi/Tetstr1/435930/TSEL_024812.t1
MEQHHTEPTLLRLGDDNLCAISLSKEDKETIVIYLTESEFDPSELLVHPFSQTVRQAGELGGNTGHNLLRRTAMGMRKKARKTPPASFALRAEQRPVYTLTLQLAAHHHSIISGTRGAVSTEQWRKTVSTACGEIKTAPAVADDEAELELNYEKNGSAMDVDTAHRGAAEAPAIGKRTTTQPSHLAARISNCRAIHHSNKQTSCFKTNGHY